MEGDWTSRITYDRDSKDFVVRALDDDGHVVEVGHVGSYLDGEQLFRLWSADTSKDDVMLMQDYDGPARLKQPGMDTVQLVALVDELLMPTMSYDARNLIALWEQDKYKLTWGNDKPTQLRVETRSGRYFVIEVKEVDRP